MPPTLMTERLTLQALARVVAVTHPDNAPSQRVARRIGMTDRGTSDRHYDTTTHLFELTP